MKRIYITGLFLIIAIHGCAQISQGYTDKLSYRAGETVTFYLDAGCQLGCTLNLQIEDIAGTNIIYTIGNIDVPVSQSITNSDPWANGFGYDPSLTIWNVPSALPSGYYMIDDANNPNNSTRIPIIIKGNNTNDPLTGADIVIVCPTNTTNAYTTSGGSSLYDVINQTTTVSFHRPQNNPHYQYFAGFTDWVRTWAATNGYNLNFISDADMDDWNEIKDAKLLIIPGHSEYWTRQARLNFDAFVDEGKNALILSGNTMWCQVRYEDQSYSADLTKLTCYRGANWCIPPNSAGQCFTLDNTTDPLLRTYAWLSTDLKYSVLGSIGCDWLRGGQVEAFSPLKGHHILIPQSPLLNWPGGPTFSFNDIIDIPYDQYVEYDGTLVESDDNGNAILVNGEPVLDIEALGFYQAEMIGYNKLYPDAQFNDPNPNNQNNGYCPFLVFKKTFTSGTIINVSSNRWCSDEDNLDWTTNQNTAHRPLITANMITLMIADYNNAKNGELLFTNAGTNNPGPEFIAIEPAYTSVSYSACTDGTILFSPHGIYLDKAYKVDNGFTSNPDHTYYPTPPTPLIQTRYINDIPSNITAAYFDPTCTTYQPLRVATISNENINDNEQNDDLVFALYPNPTNGTFTLQMKSPDAGIKDISIYTSIGTEILSLEKLTASKTVFDLSSHPKGIYFAKVIIDNKVAVNKIILQ